MSRWRTRDFVAAASIPAAIATVGVAVDPTVRFAFESEEIRLALQIANAMIAMLLAYLSYGRFRRRRQVGELALVYALGLLAATNLFFAAFPEPDLRTGNLAFQVWVPTVLRLIAGMGIAFAALVPDRVAPPLTSPGTRVFLMTMATMAAVVVTGAVLAELLPTGVAVRAETVGAPELDAHPLLRLGVLTTAVLFAAAAYGFTRRAERRTDALATALAVASALSAFASLCYFIYPSVETSIIQSGDWLRLGFYLVLLVGAEREIDRYWGQLATFAVYEERRRLARELHDGVAQELAFVVTQTRILQKGNAPPGTDQQVAAAAERALDESRRAITALTGDVDEPLHLAVARAAEDVAGRVGVRVQVRASPNLRVAPIVREGLVRIVRESVTNAGRHGKASTVDVLLTGDGVLRITDDGEGFVVEGAGEGRFGLVSMRERAERMGAKFRIESVPGRGTAVEVALP